MRLVKHVQQGYGHARHLADGRWVVRFFANYDFPCYFVRNPSPRVLTFIDNEETPND